MRLPRRASPVAVGRPRRLAALRLVLALLVMVAGAVVTARGVALAPPVPVHGLGFSPFVDGQDPNFGAVVSLPQVGRDPSRLTLEDFDAPFISEFLHHVEQARRNGARTRNVRLAAIHAFFRYVAIGDRPTPIAVVAFWRFPPNATSDDRSPS